MIWSQKPFARPGMVLLYVMLALAAFVGMVSLSVDVAHVQVVKSQLRQAADAAARYAAVGLQTSPTAALNNAVIAAGYNVCDGTAVTLDPNNDIQLGSWNASSRTFTPLTGSAQSAATAVRVTARRTVATGNAVKLSFAPLIGISTCDVHSTATAVSSTYGFAIVGISSLSTGTQGGNHYIHIDSWNSSVSAYGTYPMSSNGNCSSNGNINLISGTVINGSCQPGTGKSVSMSGSTVTGSTAPLSYTLNFPPPNPGSAATINDNANLPGAYFNSSTGDFTIPNNVTLTLPGGTYYINNLDWEAATITFTGPAVFYITGTGNSKHASNGFWTFNNHITTYQNLPKNLKFEVCSATKVQYDFDQACYAVLYAPLATVTTWGNADDYGAVVGNVLNMYVGWHVDETLGGAGVQGKIWVVQ